MFPQTRFQKCQGDTIACLKAFIRAIRNTLSLIKMHGMEEECLFCKFQSFNLLLVVCNVHNCVKRLQRTKLHEFLLQWDVHYYAIARFAYVDN